jgi:hypothetical protein
LWDVGFESWRCRAGEIAARDLSAEEWGILLGGEPYQRTTPYGLMLEAHRHALRGEKAQSRAAFSAAAKWAATIKDGQLNNNVAWWGTLDGSADLILPACDAGVRESGLAAKPFAHDTRGVALACAGKLKEAASEFEKYLEWSEKILELSKNRPDLEALRENFEPLREKRAKWVTELNAGRNPFDSRTLEALRNE